jgi:hypothetical protein
MNDQAIAANSSIDERGLRAWLLRRFRALFDFKIIVTRFRNASAKSTKAVLRRQATAALVDAIRRQAPKDQVRTVVESVAESLQQLQRESVYRACADLTDLVRVHPRMVDPASFGLRAGDSRPVIRASLLDPLPSRPTHKIQYFQRASDRYFTRRSGTLVSGHRWHLSRLARLYDA